MRDMVLPAIVTILITSYVSYSVALTAVFENCATYGNHEFISRNAIDTRPFDDRIMDCQIRSIDK